MENITHLLKSAEFVTKSPFYINLNQFLLEPPDSFEEIASEFFILNPEQMEKGRIQDFRRKCLQME